MASEFTTEPWLFSTSAAWLYCRMHGGTIPVRTHLRGPRTSLCLLDDPVTFAINEDHAPKIRSCKDRPLCEAREDEMPHPMRRPLANTLVRSFRARPIRPYKV